ncbi:hypothetical protein RGU13_17070 [Sphingomonas sp. 10B4]|nr:hypothetical protein [Sphingomonas sp. 10B4]MDY7525736.1 hypothetical protein [Sphingomonas sp. 10B4]
MSNGRWIESWCSSLISSASRRRSRSSRLSASPASESRDQRSASARIALTRESSVAVTVCGKTKPWTSAPHRIPIVISSTRRIAVVKIAPGASTEGKPMMLAV